MHIKMPVGHAMSKILFVFLIALLLPLASPSVASDTFRIEFLGASDAALDNPHDIKLSPDGEHLFVSDVDNNRVAVLDAETLLQVTGTGWPEKGPGRFTTPEGVELRGETLWISDSGNDRIVKYRITRN